MINEDLFLIVCKYDVVFVFVGNGYLYIIGEFIVSVIIDWNVVFIFYCREFCFFWYGGYWWIDCLICDVEMMCILVGYFVIWVFILLMKCVVVVFFKVWFCDCLVLLYVLI